MKHFKLSYYSMLYGNKDNNDSGSYAGYQGFGLFNSNLCTKLTGLNFVNSNSSVLLGGFNFNIDSPSNVLKDFRFNIAVFQKPQNPQVI